MGDLKTKTVFLQPNVAKCGEGEGSSFKCTLSLNFEYHHSWPVAAEHSQFLVRKVTQVLLWQSVHFGE